MSELMTALPEVSTLTAKLAEALMTLGEAKQHAERAQATAAEAQDHYRDLFDLVKALQKEINDAISVCLGGH